MSTTTGMLQRLKTAAQFVVFHRTEGFHRALQPLLLTESDKYPSMFNDGYLHIDRTIELVKYFGLDPSLSIIDIGAAEGHVAKRFVAAFPEAKVVGFEPLQSTFERLKTVTAGTGMVLKNVALGARCETLTMNVTHRVTCSSLLPIKEGIRDDYLAESICRVGTENVVVSTLDRELEVLGMAGQDVNIIKLDIQGGELAAMHGGRRTMKRTNVVVVEMQNHDIYSGAPGYFEVDAFLREAGFVLFDLVPSIRRGRRLYEWDGIYANKRLDVTNATCGVSRVANNRIGAA